MHFIWNGIQDDLEVIGHSTISLSFGSCSSIGLNGHKNINDYSTAIIKVVYCPAATIMPRGTFLIFSSFQISTLRSRLNFRVSCVVRLEGKIN